MYTYIYIYIHCKCKREMFLNLQNTVVSPTVRLRGRVNMPHLQTQPRHMNREGDGYTTGFFVLRKLFWLTEPFTNPRVVGFDFEKYESHKYIITKNHKTNNMTIRLGLKTALDDPNDLVWCTAEKKSEPQRLDIRGDSPIAAPAAYNKLQLGAKQSPMWSSGWWLGHPSENMKVNWDDEIPNIWENRKCSKPPTRSSGSPMLTVFKWIPDHNRI